jgi:cellulose synthase/poly-beta-1,6-N-acetylglucosamine synthase-like glycosyltransferase
MFIFSINLILNIRGWILSSNDDVLYKHNNPSVSILVPAYNEEVNIVDSIKSSIKQNYENYDIIIINDGSTDETLSKLISEFNLENVKHNKKRSIDNHNKVDSVYNKGRITLLNKVNGGKADALNAGFAYSSSEYILSVDGDTLLKPNCISTLMSKKKPGVDAIASMVGICNDNEIIDGEVISPKIPKNFWARIQWMEYNRSYMLLRNSLRDKNCVTVIPGACSLVSSEMIEKTGGYKHNHLGEDMEHTLNIHKQGGKIQFLTEILSWTEAPDNMKDLSKQRIRWFRGALDSYSSYFSLIFRKENKVFNWFMLPYIWISDILGCWIELFGWIFAIYTILTNSYDYIFFFILWTFIVILHYINFVIGLMFIKYRLKIYDSYKSVFLITLVEGFSYHYLYIYWILKAHVLEFIGREKKWNKLERKGFDFKK